jgi:putative heme-binding domain-containing protein
VLNFVGQLRTEPGPAFALLYALGEGLHYTRSSLAMADENARMQPFYSEAMNAVVNTSVAAPLRIEAIQVLRVGPYGFANAGDVLLLLLGSGQPASVQSAALATLGRFADPRLVPAVTQRWRMLTPRVRSDAITALLGRDERVATVMTALENGGVASTQLSSTQMNFLRTSRDAAVRQRAQKLFGPVPLEQPKLMHQFWPALALKASASRGRQIFAGRCAACHQGGSAGGSIGPDLAGAKVYSKEWILRSIVEPNVQIRPDYRTHVVVTAEGENLVGVMRDENAATIILQPPTGGPVVLPRDNILYLQAQPWSLMPERLDAGLTTQNMADLVEYVFTAAP